MRPGLLLALLLCPVTAAAAPAVLDARLDYTATVHGLPVLDLRAQFEFWPGGYRMRLAYHTVGLVGFFYRGRQVDRVAGTWHDGQAVPRSYHALGRWHGETHLLVMDYRAGRPIIRRVVPPISTERHPVPPAQQRGTIDTLSAVVDLLRRVAASGGCDDHAQTFDGRRLSVIASSDAGLASLPHPGGVPGGSVPTAGPALRCAITGRMLAGFLFGHSQRDSRPLRGTVWFARLAADGTPLPVRLRFQTDWFGEMTMVLRHAALGPPDLTTVAVREPRPSPLRAAAGSGVQSGTASSR